ncbi:DUF3108 domain-containing protein [bacterium]|nr:DUF3108 domain-containing protein [bacterium]
MPRHRPRALTLHALVMSGLALTVPPGVAAGPAPGDETLSYRIRVGPWTAGEVVIAARREEHPVAGPALAIELTARSGRMLSALYPIRDRLTSVAALDDLRCLTATRRIREGRRRLADTWTIDHARGEARDRAGKVVPVPEGVHDVLSALWRLRSIAMAPGDTVALPTLLGGRVASLVVRVGDPRRIRVPAGEFDCLPLYPAVDRVARAGEDARLVIHREVGGARRPALIEVELPIVGRARIEMVGHR